MNNNESLRKMVHDARAPLNRISMNAELVKLVLENDMPKQKALEAINKIAPTPKRIAPIREIATINRLELLSLRLPFSS